MSVRDERERALWAEEIAGAMKRLFHMTIANAEVIDQGWLNVKWRMETDLGPVFVKFYHPDRYRLDQRPDRRAEMEWTLRLQHGLSEAGVPCPEVYSRDGRFIHKTPGGLWFAVTEWVEGRTAPAGRMTNAQMYELGKAAGRMHAWLRSVPRPDRTDWTPDPEAYWREWEGNRHKAEAAGDETVLGWLARSKELVQSLDFGQFAACPAGWLHWDLWVDNIVLQGDRVAGIVDFDRMAFAYPGIDVARALLSGALQDGHLRLDAVRSFLEGYLLHSGMSQGLLALSIRMLYLIESNWWLRTEVRRDSGLRKLLGRFVEEMHWIEDHWAQLPELLEGA
jgi:homoserine kinase type II